MSTGNAMRRLMPLGSFLLVLFFLTGIWLTISPFVMTTQPSGQHWIASTIMNVAAGGILMVVSLLGTLGYMGFALRDLIRETQAKQAAEQAALEPAQANS